MKRSYRILIAGVAGLLAVAVLGSSVSADASTSSKSKTDEYGVKVTAGAWEDFSHVNVIFKPSGGVKVPWVLVVTTVAKGNPAANPEPQFVNVYSHPLDKDGHSAPTGAGASTVWEYVKDYKGVTKPTGTIHLKYTVEKKSGKKTVKHVVHASIKVKKGEPTTITLKY